MMKIASAAILSMFLAAPAFAQTVPANNGLSELNAQGTVNSAPCYGCNLPQVPSNCAADDTRKACEGNGLYDERPYGSDHPGANGLNWQPLIGHDTGA